MFRCARQGCGSTEVRRYGGCDREEATMWLAGDPMDPIREIPDKAAWEAWIIVGRSEGYAAVLARA